MKLDAVLNDLNNAKALKLGNTLIINYQINIVYNNGKTLINNIIPINDFIMQIKSLLNTSFYISYNKININMESALISHCKRVITLDTTYKELDKGNTEYLFSSPSLNYDNKNYNSSNSKTMYYTKYYENYIDYYNLDDECRFDFVNRNIQNTKNFIEKELKEQYIEYTFPFNDSIIHPLDNCIILQQIPHQNINTNKNTIMEILYNITSNTNTNNKYNLIARFNIEEQTHIAKHKIDKILYIHNTIKKIIKQTPHTLD
jgi:hypothetical protein